MNQVHVLADVGTVLIQVVFWICVGFVGGVSTFWPWWKSDLGWTINLKTICIALILLRAVLHFEFGLNTTSLVWDWLGVVCFGLVGVILIWRFIVIYMIQRHDPPATKSGRHAFNDRNGE